MLQGVSNGKDAPDFALVYGNPARIRGLSLHLEGVYKSSAHKIGDSPKSEWAQEQVLSLPIYPELTEGQLEEVVNEVKKSLYS